MFSPNQPNHLTPHPINTFHYNHTFHPTGTTDSIYHASHPPCTPFRLQYNLAPPNPTSLYMAILATYHSNNSLA